MVPTHLMASMSAHPESGQLSPWGPADMSSLWGTRRAGPAVPESSRAGADVPIAAGDAGGGGASLEAILAALGHWCDHSPGSPAGGSPPEDKHSDSAADRHAEAGVDDAAAPVPHLAQIQQSFGPGHDLSSLRTTMSPAAAAAGRRLGALHYTFGNRIAFGSAPSVHDAAHEAAHAVMQQAGMGPGSRVGQAGDAYEVLADKIADRVVAGKSAADLLPSPAKWGSRSGLRALQRKELPKGSQVSAPSDWTVTDREKNTAVWKRACQYNLDREDSQQYRRIPERRDFYKWFYVRSTEMGFKTRWALAANLVASGADQVANPSTIGSLGETFGAIGPELQAMMRTGNQVIFDNVFPKLHALLKMNPAKMSKAQSLEWDMQTLSEEQQLVQPLYNQMSAEAKLQMNKIARKQGLPGIGAWLTGGDKVNEITNDNGLQVAQAGKIPAFSETNLENSDDRWTYGMKLGKQFAPEDTGFVSGQTRRPDPGAGYKNGDELNKVNTRPHLHMLDANLNRFGTTGDIIEGILGTLTPAERVELTLDNPPDGGRYSERLADWLGTSEGVVRGALTKDPNHASAVQAFMDRWKAEHDRLELKLELQRYQRMPM